VKKLPGCPELNKKNPANSAGFFMKSRVLLKGVGISKGDGHTIGKFEQRIIAGLIILFVFVDILVENGCLS
jgi:hypothetical protein